MAHLFNGHVIDCCGCGACKQICPVDCISMVADAKGFYYPVPDATRCLRCDRCTKVCPCLNDVPRNDPEPIVYAAIHRNRRSTLTVRPAAPSPRFAPFCDETPIYSALITMRTSSLSRRDTLRISRDSEIKICQSDTRLTFSQAKKSWTRGRSSFYRHSLPIAGLRYSLKTPIPTC
jgi:Pyruvate/2-oxoacid:ferredoxin oxidoreductase delta subunit